MQCLSEQVLTEFVESTLHASKLPFVDQHLNSCEECRRVVAAVVATMPINASQPFHLDDMGNVPTVGRYVVLNIIGEGAMGIVYGAYDPQLDRNVAVKLLHPDLSGSRTGLGPSRKQRLLREARAMARLVHPNVVTVHDTGITAGQVFVAMEYVDGSTLRQWLRQPRSVEDIIDVFAQAGLGLLAAHRAGFVHRDFKPDNVFVSNSGSVKVGDFGLASSLGANYTEYCDGQHHVSEQVHVSNSSTVVPHKTQAGVRLGTMRYMSPEQYDASNVQFATDQFSFCVSLYEALYGVHPFTGNGGTAIRQSIHNQNISAPNTKRDVPQRIHCAVLRGLKENPNERYPSMEALLSALTSKPVITPKRCIAAATTVLALIISAFAIIDSNFQDAADHLEACPAPTAALDGVWDQTKHAQLQAAFDQNTHSRAHRAVDRVAIIFDGFRRDWLAMHVQTCKATYVHGHQSQHLFDLRVHCLKRRRAVVSASMSLFLEHATDPSFIDRAIPAAMQISSIEDCANIDSLLRRAPKPRSPERIAQIAALETQLDYITALKSVGDYRNALQHAQSLSENTKTLDYAHLHAQVLFEIAFLHFTLADFDASAKAIPRVLQAAAAEADDQYAADAWLLLQTVEIARGNHHEALRLQPWVEAAVARAGNTPEQKAKLATNRAATSSMTK